MSAVASAAHTPSNPLRTALGARKMAAKWMAARTPAHRSDASSTKEPTDSSEGVGRTNSNKKRWGRPRSSKRHRAAAASSRKPPAYSLPARAPKARLCSNVRVCVP